MNIFLLFNNIKPHNMISIKKTVSLLIISTLSINFSFAQWSEDANNIWGTDSRKAIGIGTATPKAKLEVMGEIKGYIQLHLGENYDAINGRGIIVDNGASTSWELLTLRNNFGTHFKVDGNGRVGIGTNAPKEKLDVMGSIRSIKSGDVGPYISLSNPSKTDPAAATTWNIYNMTGGYGNSLQFWGYSNTENLGPKLTIKDNGNVGIGTITPTEKLSVNGNIKAKKLIVTQTGWADYVFDKAYTLMTVDSLSTYIKTHKHLPEMPTTKDVQDHGVDVGNNQTLLLKKIEELTLYIIQQNERIKKLENAQISNVPMITKKIN